MPQKHMNMKKNTSDKKTTFFRHLCVIIGFVGAPKVQNSVPHWQICLYDSCHHCKNIPFAFENCFNVRLELFKGIWIRRAY